MRTDIDDLDAIAKEALEAARRMPHGPTRSEAMKKAGQLRLVADARRARMAPIISDDSTKA
jgi:hypothetical protein